MDYVDFCLNICSAIYRLAGSMKDNRERCQRVAQRVRTVEPLIRKIKARGPGLITPPVEAAVRDLYGTLVSARAMMGKYAQTGAVMSFLKAAKHEDKFNKVNQRLDDNLQVLTNALQIEQSDILFSLRETVEGGGRGGGGSSSSSPYPPPAPCSPISPFAPSPPPIFPPTSPFLPSPPPVFTSTSPFAIPPPPQVYSCPAPLVLPPQVLPGAAPVFVSSVPRQASLTVVTTTRPALQRSFTFNTFHSFI